MEQPLPEDELNALDDWRILKPIVIITDQKSLDGAIAIRSGIEMLGFRVFLLSCGLRNHVFGCLSGNIPDCEHVILCTHGDEGKIYFGVYPETWIGADEIVDRVNLKGKLVISLGCGAGNRKIADAFLKSGCRSFIGSEKFTRSSAVLIFPLLFYAYLKQHLDSNKPRLTERQAFQEARTHTPEGDVYEFYD